MEAALIVLRQTVVMFLYMFAGYILFRTEKLTIRGSRDIAAILVWLVIPAVIVNSFCVEFSRLKLIQLVQSALISALGIGIAMIIAALIFKIIRLIISDVLFPMQDLWGFRLCRLHLGMRRFFI